MFLSVSHLHNGNQRRSTIPSKHLIIGVLVIWSATARARVIEKPAAALIVGVWANDHHNPKTHTAGRHRLIAAMFAPTKSALCFEHFVV